jgi:ferrous iron transport protein B
MTTPATPSRVLLLGRPNAGKSSLYNRITGGQAKEGNFPGVTVDTLDAEVVLPNKEKLRLIDLPGAYSLKAEVDPNSDEGIARGFLQEAEKKGDAIIAQVLDVTQLALHLRLTRELLERPLPLLLLLTQCDVLAQQGRELDEKLLSRELGVPVLAVSARDPKARAKVLDFFAAQRKAERPSRATPPAEVEDIARRAIRDRIDVRPEELSRRVRTQKLDKVFLHPVLGPLLFFSLMTALFASVFLIADPISTLVDGFMQWLAALAEGWLGEGLLSSLVADGILGGAGTVLIFLPQIVILTLAMELLEASGYLVRGAFLVDSLLRRVGLGGRSFVPLLTGHACAVPAITATRVIRDPKQRLRTILVVPLITCSARIPTYGLLLATFLAASGPLVQSLVFVGLYLLGILFACLVSMVLQKTVQKGNALPLVLEMPAYRTPSPGAVFRAVWRVIGRFTKEVGTYILLASVGLWALLTIQAPASLQSAPPKDAPPSVVTLHGSIAATVGKALEPVTSPLGFDWRLNVGLIGSFSARELMVSTTGIIFGIEDAEGNEDSLATQIREAKREDGTQVYSTATGLALMIFFVLACQCMSTVAAIKRETRSWRWPLFVVGYTYALAYFAAFLTYQGARLFGL